MFHVSPTIDGVGRKLISLVLVAVVIGRAHPLAVYGDVETRAGRAVLEGPVAPVPVERRGWTSGRRRSGYRLAVHEEEVLPAIAAKNEFHLYNWNNYLAPETVKRFEDVCKCTVVQTFDAATDCTSALRDWEDGDYGRPAAGETPEHHRAINQLLAQFPAQCIATDDPRLKGK